jgi:hypothetical protein
MRDTLFLGIGGRKSIILLEGSQALSASPSDKNKKSVDVRVIAGRSLRLVWVT